MCRVSRTLVYLVTLLVLSSALLGCGQKGPLYLPEEGKAKKEKSESSSSK